MFILSIFCLCICHNVNRLNTMMKKTNPHICSFMVQNAFPVTGQLYTTHLLSLEALLTVIDSIEDHCQAKVMTSAPQQDQVEAVPAEGKADGSGGPASGTPTAGSPQTQHHAFNILLG